MFKLPELMISHYQAIRQKLHSHPELRYEELNTAKIVAEELTRLGLNVQTGVGKTGVVAVLDSGVPGKTIALRADMDALPIQEESTQAYRSQIAGKMHACGHDGHTATLLAAAYLLTQAKNSLSGKVKFIFQPGEEGGAGAKAMIEEGVLENPKVDAIFAFHNYPGIALCHISAKEGTSLYGNAIITFKIIGKGGHAAQPERTINPIMIAAKLLNASSPLMSMLMMEKEPTILNFTQIMSGTASNIVPEETHLIGTVRAATQDKLRQVYTQLLAISHRMQQENPGILIDFIFEEIYPPTINTEPETAFVLNLARDLFGEQQTEVKARSSRASEDFSYYLQKIPGCYFFIGNGLEAPSCHSVTYDFNDAIIPVGAQLLASIARNYALSYTQTK